MPIYEYACPTCRKRVSIFFRTIAASEVEEARCPICGGASLQRLVSRIVVARDDESRMEDLADPSLMAALEQEDPRALASFMRQMSEETGEPIDAEMDEVIGRMEAGESMESIEESMPDVD